jgi:hypothetical protein
MYVPPLAVLEANAVAIRLGIEWPETHFVRRLRLLLPEAKYYGNLEETFQMHTRVKRMVNSGIWFEDTDSDNDRELCPEMREKCLRATLDMILEIKHMLNTFQWCPHVII